MPIISQCPVVVSLPAERSVARPNAAPGSARGSDTVDLRQVPETEGLEVRGANPPDGPGRVPERVGKGVAVGLRVRRIAHAP